MAAAVLVAAVLLSPASRAAEPSRPLPVGAVDAGLRAVVANGGYADDSYYRGLPGHEDGDVYYLAELTRPADDAVLDALSASGVRLRHVYRAIPWVAVASPASAVATVAALPEVKRLESDLVHSVLVDSDADPAMALQVKRGTGDVGATALWAQGITGAGVTVGVADTGVDGAHPDLDDLDWQQWDDPSGAKLSWFADCVGASGVGFADSGCRPVPAYDDHGHGTHVSGIAVGSAEGGTSAQRGLYPGIAPGSSLAVAKVLSGAGTGSSSDVMAGFEALATEKPEGAGADVINASLGSGRLVGAPLFYAEQVTNTDATALMVNALAQQHNVVFTISAGNSGPTIQSLGSPGVASQALTVGASVADFDLDAPLAETVHGEWGNTRPEAAAAGASALADFSSRGPSGDRLIKPDLTAPGVYWVAAQSKEGAELAVLDAGHLHSFSADPTYAVLSGTSMSAPAAAGAAALVIDGWNQATSSAPWRYEDVKAALVNTAGDRAFEGAVTGAIGTITTKVQGKSPQDIPLRNAEWVGVTGEGAGRLDAGRAIAALTRGIIAHTVAEGPVDDVHELQPSWSMDEVAPGESSSTTFELRSGPKAAPNTKVTFSAAPEPQAAGVQPLPVDWLDLPGSGHGGTRVTRGGTAQATFALDVPADATPGLYAGVITATAKLGGGLVQNLRIPVEVYVPMVVATGVTTSIDRADLWASDTTDYSFAGSRSPLADIFTDWITYPVRLPADAGATTFKAWDPADADALDLFVFDDAGVEIDSTVSFRDRHVVPAGAALSPTGPGSPAEVTILDGDDNSDAEVAPGSTVWVVVSLTNPSAPNTFRPYHLEVAVAGGGGGGPVVVTAPDERIHSGDHAWWSGSTTDANHTLTTSVVLPADAELSFWTWYELEDGFDFTYVLVSEDGGATWSAVPTTGADGAQGTTSLDPLAATPFTDRGASYAHGFTGVSGQPPTYTGVQVADAAYVQQIADLSAYEGSVLLRFEYRSDGGVDWSGFYLDDIQLGGALDQAESAGAWTAVGFQLVTKESAASD